MGGGGRIRTDSTMQPTCFSLQVQSFVEAIEGSATLYGYRKQTLYSMFLVMLPRQLKEFHPTHDPNTSLFEENRELYCHLQIVEALQKIGIDVLQVSVK